MAFAAHAMEPENLWRLKVPPPPWPKGDERGMANQIGPATFARCAWHMQQPGARSYELSYLRSNTMPLSPFAGPYAVRPKPSAGLPGTAHAFNSEQFNENAEPAQQGTQMDALAHFGAFKAPWDGKLEFPAKDAVYYGGFTQQDVKPTPDSPLLKLGIDKAPPIITSAVLLDAKSYKKESMKAGEVVTAQGPRGDAQGARAVPARRAAGRRGVRAHRLRRPLARPGHREALLRQGARPRVRRRAVARREAHRRDPRSTRRSSMRSPRACWPARQARRRARRRGCRSRCTTTCSPRRGSTWSRTRSSTRSPPSACGPSAPHPAAARQRRRRLRHSPDRGGGFYKTCTKMRASPITETSHTAVRR